MGAAASLPPTARLAHDVAARGGSAGATERGGAAGGFLSLGAAASIPSQAGESHAVGSCTCRESLSGTGLASCSTAGRNRRPVWSAFPRSLIPAP